MSHRWFRRVLSLCPTAIAVLWVGGIAHFRGHPLSTQDWLVLVAAAVGLGIVARRLQRPRPLPQLPEHSNPITISALAAALIALFTGLLAGILELVADSVHPSERSWLLRTTWHAACAFAASYCQFLLRLTASRQKAGPKT